LGGQYEGIQTLYRESMKNNESYQPEARAVDSESRRYKKRSGKNSDCSPSDRKRYSHEVRRSELIAEGDSRKNYDEEEAHKVNRDDITVKQGPIQIASTCVDGKRYENWGDQCAHEVARL
jgi:hypothetical protein